MSRSDWGILTALAGLAAIFVAFGTGLFLASLSYPREQRYQTYRYSAEQPAQVAAEARASSQPLQYRTPCRQPEGQGESDLCAQWHAANAAQDGAFWTKWGVLIGIVGSSLLLWQIILTRQAVKDTSGATVAMREANRIALDTSKRELRAYITTEDHEVINFQIGAKAGHQCKVYNRGHTPAYNVRIWSRPIAVITAGTDLHRAKVFRAETVTQSSATLGPGQWVGHTNALNSPLVEDSYVGICVGGVAIVWAGVVTYRDAFGRLRRTTFKYFVTGSGETLPGFFDMTACSRGNIAN